MWNHHLPSQLPASDLLSLKARWEIWRQRKKNFTLNGARSVLVNNSILTLIVWLSIPLGSQGIQFPIKVWRKLFRQVFSQNVLNIRKQINIFHLQLNNEIKPFTKWTALQFQNRPNLISFIDYWNIVYPNKWNVLCGCMITDSNVMVKKYNLNSIYVILNSEYWFKEFF